MKPTLERKSCQCCVLENICSEFSTLFFLPIRVPDFITLGCNVTTSDRLLLSPRAAEYETSQRTDRYMDVGKIEFFLKPL